MCLFGNITGSKEESDTIPKMILNDAGLMIEKWYYGLQNKFPDIKCHEMIIMPNHFHAIIENTGCPATGADLRVCPLIGEHDEKNRGEHDGNIRGEHKGSPLFRVVQWFKTMTTNEYIRGVKTMNWVQFPGKLWQRNYYERIIYNEKSYNAIRKYIINNPKKWWFDQFRIK